MKFILIILFFITSILAEDNLKKSRSIAETKVLIDDTVKRIMSQDQSEKIIFQRHAGIYYLRSGSKHYDSIKAALELSQKNKESVQIKVDPNTMEIEEMISLKK